MKRPIEQSQQRLADDLLRRRDVVAVGVGADNGEPCLKVYVSGRGDRRSIPQRFDGHRVHVVGGGPFRAQADGPAAR